MKSPKWIGAAAAGALAVTAAVVLWPKPERAPQPVAAPVPGAVGAPTSSATTTPAQGCDFVVGQRFAKAASFGTRWEFPSALQAAAPQARDGAASWSSELQFEVLAVEPEGAVLLARLTELSAAVRGEALDAPWLVRIDSRCELQGFARHTRTSVEDGRQQQALVAELSFTLAGEAPAGLTFSNAMGRAQATVTREGDVLVRRISRYATTWSADMSGLTVASSALSVRRGEAPWFDSMHGVEEFSAGALARGHAELSVVPTAVEEAALASVSHQPADYVWEDLLGPVVRAELRVGASRDHAQRVTAMRDVGYETALERFAVTATSTKNLSAQWPDLAAFLDAHPETIEDFTNDLVTEFPPAWKAGGFLALGGAQHPAAREALMTVWRERQLGSADRTRASLALVTRPDVGVAFAKELRAEWQRKPESGPEADTSRHALLHMGILAAVHPADVALVGETHEALAAALRSISTLDEARVVFAAVGNTSDESFLPQLTEWSRNADPDMRATVAIGMRRMDVEAALPFTLEWLRRETHPDVMREIFEVVQHQYQDAGRPVGRELLAEAVKHLKQQPRVLTRQSLFRILEPHVALDAETRAAMREQLKVEYENRSGLFAFVASTLPQHDVEVALSEIPTLHDQFVNVSAAPPSPPEVADEVNPPPTVLPRPPTDEEKDGRVAP